MRIKNAFEIDQHLEVEYQDEGPWRSFDLKAEGNSYEQILDDAAIFEIDQDGGELRCYGLSEASEEVRAAAMKVIEGMKDQIDQSYWESQQPGAD